MRKIAIYGKGGIGKSTISANLSAALALCGNKVLQIGCDPKHDSTRLLLHGQRLTTVMDYMRVTPPLDYKLDDILAEGFAGVGCVEAGGPKPGVGCAGRGIISTFELLDQFTLKTRYNVTVYDVLGDVVCGGFAVPIRREYADTIFIVTSGEFMALYAANNILRGIRNFDGENTRVAGIICNKRNLEDEDARVIRFARAVGLPLCATIPRSDIFSWAEQEYMTVMEQNANMAICDIFRDLAQRVLSDQELYEACPLTDEALEETVLGRSSAYPVRTIPAMAKPTSAALEVQAPMIDLADPNRYLSKNLIRDEPLHGCAFNGAVSTALHLSDAIVLAHAPKSCAFITWQTVSSTGRRTFFERGVLLPVSLAPNLECTELGEAEVIFGGMETLENKIRELKSRKPCAIIVVSACPAGIIGDDIGRAENFAEPDVPIVAVKADGNMAGDYLQGMLMSYLTLARRFIIRGVPVVPDSVNIVFEKTVVTNTNDNFRIMRSYLARLGIRVNCRFLYETTVDALRNFCAAPLNLLAYGDYTGKLLRDFFTREYGALFFGRAFPVGYDETAEWLRGVAEFFNRPSLAEDIIADNDKRYAEEIDLLRPVLAGKKLMIITYNHELDWILKTALDADMEIVMIGVLNFSQDEVFRTQLTMSLPVIEGYSRDKRTDDLYRYKPDVLLTNYASSVAEDVPVTDTIPMCPDVGFDSGLKLAKRWARLLKLNLKGGWKEDERLFNQYYAR